MISEFFADGMIPWSPILLSLKVAGLATAASFCAGVAAAWLLARRRSPFSAVLDAMCTLPMILPPTVLGYYLILLVGRRGVIGPWLAECGINLIFSWQGAVVAATVVVFPLIYKSARAALELVDPRLENAARTLGASEWKVFWQVSLPLAWRGIVAGVFRYYIFINASGCPFHSVNKNHSFCINIVYFRNNFSVLSFH